MSAAGASDTDYECGVCNLQISSDHLPPYPPPPPNELHVSYLYSKDRMKEWKKGKDQCYEKLYKN